MNAANAVAEAAEQALCLAAEDPEFCAVLPVARSILITYEDEGDITLTVTPAEGDAVTATVRATDLSMAAPWLARALSREAAS